MVSFIHFHPAHPFFRPSGDIKPYLASIVTSSFHRSNSHLHYTLSGASFNSFDANRSNKFTEKKKSSSLNPQSESKATSSPSKRNSTGSKKSCDKKSNKSSASSNHRRNKISKYDADMYVVPAIALQRTQDPYRILEILLDDLKHENRNNSSRFSLPHTLIASSLFRIAKNTALHQNPMTEGNMHLRNPGNGYDFNQGADAGTRASQVQSQFRVGLKKVIKAVVEEVQIWKFELVVEVFWALGIFQYPILDLDDAEEEEEGKGFAQPSWSSTLDRFEAVFFHNRQQLCPSDASNIAWTYRVLAPNSPIPQYLIAITDSLPFHVYIDPFNIRSAKNQPRREENILPVDISISNLVQEIDFQRDLIKIGQKQVLESRLTAWQSLNNKPFFYSEKVMMPTPFTPTVMNVANQINNLTGIMYDNVLINYYPDGQAGMRYHIDPDQGIYWTTDTAVLSIGNTRQFIFRKIADNQASPALQKESTEQIEDSDSERFTFYVQHGDLTIMNRDCQLKYQHTIKVEDRKLGHVGPRISMVFKKSLRD